MEAAVQARVAAAVASEEVLARVAARLKEERAKLEERVTRQLDRERKMLLERKRREDAERRQAQEEMERIIQENKRKVCSVCCSVCVGLRDSRLQTGQRGPCRSECAAAGRCRQEVGSPAGVSQPVWMPGRRRLGSRGCGRSGHARHGCGFLTGARVWVRGSGGGGAA